MILVDGRDLMDAAPHGTGLLTCRTYGDGGLPGVDVLAKRLRTIASSRR